MQAVTIFQ